MAEKKKAEKEVVFNQYVKYGDEPKVPGDKVKVSEEEYAEFLELGVIEEK